MASAPEPPSEPQPQGISLDDLAAAFAQVMSVEPRRPDAAADAASAEQEQDAVAPSDQADAGEDAAAAEDDGGETADAHCPISPHTILEAMLFVGNRDNCPLSPAQAAELMRGVQVDEIPALVAELNQRYVASGRPFTIVGEGSGYRLTLRREFEGLRNRFFGRIREARLSQPAIDVLALVAYQQPITADEVSRLRDKPSNHLLAHLVRRDLLRIERPDPKQRTPHYCTTARFLQLFCLQSLDDLPRSEDPTPP